MRLQPQPHPARRQQILDVLGEFYGEVAFVLLRILMLDINRNRTVRPDMILRPLQDFSQLEHFRTADVNEYVVEFCAGGFVIDNLIDRLAISPEFLSAARHNIKHAEATLDRHVPWQRHWQRAGAIANQRVSAPRTAIDGFDPVQDQAGIKPKMMPDRDIRNRADLAANETKKIDIGL